MKRYYLPALLTIMVSIILTAIMARPYRLAAEAAYVPTETVVTMTLTQGNGTHTRTLYATDDAVQRILQESTVDVAGYAEADRAAIEEKSAAIRQTCEALDCVRYTAAMDGDTFRECFDFDTSSKSNVRALRKAKLLAAARANVLSLDDTVEALEKDGWVQTGSN